MNQSKPAWNPWPWAIIAYFVVFISAVVGYTSFAMRQKMDLVRADYYEEELRFQQRIDSTARTRQIGSTVTVSYDAPSGQLLIGIPTATADAIKGTGKVELYRPSDARLDRHLEFSLQNLATQKVTARDLLPGLWRVRLTWGPETARFLHEETLVIPGGSS